MFGTYRSSMRCSRRSELGSFQLAHDEPEEVEALVGDVE
jgi:hypothetical protein